MPDFSQLARFMRNSSTKNIKWQWTQKSSFGQLTVVAALISRRLTSLIWGSLPKVERLKLLLKGKIIWKMNKKWECNTRICWIQNSSYNNCLVYGEQFVLSMESSFLWAYHVPTLRTVLLMQSKVEHYVYSPLNCIAIFMDYLSSHFLGCRTD